MQYAGLIQDDFVDGEGVCTSFWVQGCPICCPGCQNPQTWNPNGGYTLPKTYLKDLDMAITANGIQRNFSLLGGEPFAPYNLELSKTVLSHVKEKFPNIKTYCWTGYTLEDLKLIPQAPEILKYIDVLIDGPYVQEKRDVSLHLRGSSNQRVLYRGEDF